MTAIVKNKADAKKIKFGEPYIILTARMEREIEAQFPNPSEATLKQFDEIQALIEVNTKKEADSKEAKEFDARMAAESDEGKAKAKAEKSNRGQDKKADD